MLSFAAAAFLFLALSTGAVWVLGRGPRPDRRADLRVRRLREAEQPAGGPGANPTLRRSHSSVPMLRRLLDASAWAEDTGKQLERANLRLRVGEYLLMRVMLGVVAFIVVALLLSFGALGFAVGLVAGAGAYFVPAFYVGHLRRQRLARIEKQLIELAPMISSSLRAGFAMQHAVQLAAEQLGPPLAEELQALIQDVNIGAQMDDALTEMAGRIGSPDLDMMVTAILVQRTTGGNLAEILDQAGETLRDRERIRGEISTLTAQQRLTGMILAVYPAAIGLVLLAMMPSIWSVLFTDPVGRTFLGVALGLQALGFIAIRRIVQVQI